MAHGQSRGPFLRRRVLLSSPSSVLWPPPTPSRLAALAPCAYRLPHSRVLPRPGRVSPVPPSTVLTCRSLYAGGFVSAAHPSSSRLPWPSPVWPRLGSLLSPCGGSLPTRQDSLDVTAGQVAHPTGGGFVAALQRWDFSSRWPPAMGRPGPYPDRTLTGKQTEASLGRTPHEETGRSRGPAPCRPPSPRVGGSIRARAGCFSISLWTTAER